MDPEEIEGIRKSQEEYEERIKNFSKIEDYLESLKTVDNQMEPKEQLRLYSIYKKSSKNQTAIELKFCRHKVETAVYLIEEFYKVKGMKNPYLD